MNDQAQIDYLRWLSAFDPAMYARVTEANKPVSGLGWINFVIQAVGAAVGIVKKKKAEKKAKAAANLQAIQDKKALDLETQKFNLLNTNTQRAAAGLPPVDFAGKVIPGYTLPVIPSLSSTITSVTSSKAFPFLALGAAGILAFFLIKRKRR